MTETLIKAEKKTIKHSLCWLLLWIYIKLYI